MFDVDNYQIETLVGENTHTHTVQIKILEISLAIRKKMTFINLFLRIEI